MVTCSPPARGGEGVGGVLETAPAAEEEEVPEAEVAMSTVWPGCTGIDTCVGGEGYRGGGGGELMSVMRG